MLHRSVQTSGSPDMKPSIASFADIEENINMEDITIVVKDMKTPTIYDIARLAGVSPKTVSRVINNEARVSPDTYDKVMKVIREIDYRPNAFAQNLKIKKDRLVLASVNSPMSFPLQWMQMMIEQISLVCQQSGITLVVEYCYDINDMKGSVLTRSSGYVDGVIIFYEVEDDPRIRLLRDKDIPFVVFERAYDQSVEYAGNDNYGILYALFSSLAGKGLDSATLLLRRPTLVNIDRVNGALQAFRDSEKDSDCINVVYGIDGPDEAYRYTKKAAQEGNLSSLIFISGDERALGVYKALEEYGIVPGDDISIIGFDDIPADCYLTPPLSTIRPDYPRLASSLISLLFPSECGDAEKIIMPSFIPRESLQKRFH